MKKISTSLIGLSLLTFSSAIYAQDYKYECEKGNNITTNDGRVFNCYVPRTVQGSDAVYVQKDYCEWVKIRCLTNMVKKTKFMCKKNPESSSYVCKPQTKDIQSIIPYAKKRMGGWYMDSGVPILELSPMGSVSSTE